ncbi:GNAT family N-acetyltransferase [Aggregicoccus sp. 17bor-14]|uniref:GNAT family N-acetyltransferase n=1 Tax=Myxococcaceae TaxID=31 RepID=UPI00129C34A7|nr:MULTISPECIES: GNAT family N-acetyltransferase [Myxococcaceae]MBF5046221.1 GNAT family N-acetyltransferase [Simulacricoccus sp. 17bor-14]MRI91945.1 GNAT family N-acetyltransferase [Aggregicoccus sp. 17bor-14]
MGIRDAEDADTGRTGQGPGAAPPSRSSVDARTPPATPRNALASVHPAHRLFDLPQPLQVEEVCTREALLALRPEWNRLLARTGASVLSRHELLWAWLENFAPTISLRVLTARAPGGALSAVLPLLQRHARWAGLPVRELSSPGSAHLGRFDLLAEDAPAAASHFLRHLQEDPNWDLLRLEDVPHGGGAWSLQHAAEDAGLPCGSEPTRTSPALRLPCSVDALHARWSRSLRRRRKRLEDQGPVELEQVTGGARLVERLAEGLALDTCGARGRRGAAVAQDVRALGFYTDVALAAAEGGFLSLHLLRCRGYPVAFDFALRDGRRLVRLGSACDEAYRAFGPEHLLSAALLEHLVEQGFEECELLGPDAPDAQPWADRLCSHSRLLVFRASRRGRALHAARLRWLPGVQRALGWWRAGED